MSGCQCPGTNDGASFKDNTCDACTAGYYPAKSCNSKCPTTQKRDVAGAKCVDCAANEEQDPSDPTKCACKAALKFKSGCTGNCSAGYYPKDTCDKKCAANTYSDGTKAACDACDGAKGKISAEGASECTCTASDTNLKDKATDCTCKDKKYGDGDAFKQKCDKTCGANNVYAVSAGLATCKACTEGAAYGAKAD